jgi:hypothetical protein
MCTEEPIHLQLWVVLGGAELGDTGGNKATSRYTITTICRPFFLYPHVVLDNLAPSDVGGTAFARRVAHSF